MTSGRNRIGLNVLVALRRPTTEQKSLDAVHVPLKHRTMFPSIQESSFEPTTIPRRSRSHPPFEPIQCADSRRSVEIDRRNLDIQRTRQSKGSSSTISRRERSRSSFETEFLRLRVNKLRYGSRKRHAWTFARWARVSPLTARVAFAAIEYFVF